MGEDKNVLRELFASRPTIVVVGLSADPDRPSYEVSQYMQRQGFRIIPVNPRYAGSTILGERCYAELHAAASYLMQQGKSIDIVNCFRKSEHMPEIVNEAIAVKAKCIWMQLGVVHQDAASRAIESGLTVVMNKCIKIEYARLM